LSWLSDTLNGVDIYADFVKRPTIFFDPQSSASVTGLGTYRSPYTTQAEVQAAVAGNMAGRVLGIKRGSRLNVTGTNGLTFNVHGTAAKPFTICPYGDAEALPILSGEVDITASLAQAAGSTQVWKIDLGATYRDIWQDGVRLRRLHPTNGSRNNNTGTTVSNEATAVTALETKGAGWLVVAGTVAYLRPHNDALTTFVTCGTNETPVNSALKLQYADVAATGYINVAGLDCRYANAHAVGVNTPTRVSITTCDAISIVGLKVSRVGPGSSAVLGRAAFSIYGPTGTTRLTNLYVAGCYTTDALNNSIEIGGTTGAIIERNLSYDCGGALIAELWSSNSGARVRYNYGDLSNNSLRA
jgi:hypothetical protein